jgi:transcriptional regulator with XRE-family HTH domain
VRTIVEQIRDAWKSRDWSAKELLERSGLTLDRSTLERKLRGEVAMRTDEAQRLADALGITIAWIAGVDGAA